MVATPIVELVRARFHNIKETAKALTLAVEHDALRGRFREILVEDLIAPYLPPSIELLTGTIIGANGEKRAVRNEDDIVIFDHSWAPLLLKTRGRDAIIPVTGVRAQIEVKSRLTLDDVTNALKAAIELNRISLYTAPIGMLFAYDTDISKKTYIPELLLREIRALKYNPSSGQTTCPIQGVCIVGRGSWLLVSKKGYPDGWYEVDAENDNELLAFLSIVSNSMYNNKRGLGTHVLDTTWLKGPNPPMPLLQPKGNDDISE
jgi:hypothetical protein